MKKNFVPPTVEVIESNGFCICTGSECLTKEGGFLCSLDDSCLTDM